MSADISTKLDDLVQKIQSAYQAEGGVGANQLNPDFPLSSDPVMNELVFSMLLWESSVAHALKAVERIDSELVDLNELRVCTSDELSGILGARMPRSAERAHRLLLVLNTIYDRENTLELARFNDLSKKEVQEYLGDIDGLPEYVIARIILLVLGWHSMPLDERLAKMLTAEAVLESSSPLDQQAAALERAVRATDALNTYTVLEHWSQDQRVSGRARSSKNQTKGATS